MLHVSCASLVDRNPASRTLLFVSLYRGPSYDTVCRRQPMSAGSGHRQPPTSAGRNVTCPASSG
jgi:hypothetical protein